MKTKIGRVGIHHSYVLRFLEILNCTTMNLLFTYNGLPVGSNHRRRFFGNGMVSKIKKRLAKWKDKHVSLASRATLINFVLSTIPLYYLLILPTTRTWRNRFVALSVPSMRLCSLQSHPQNLLLDLQSWPAKHTDGASSGRLHSDDQVRPQNHQMRKTSSVCEKLLLSLFFFSYPPLNLSLILFYVSLPVSGPNRILLCFSGMCQNPVMLFWDNVPPESVECGCESLCVSARLCAWLRLSVPLVVRSAPLSGPHPSQMMTRGGMQLTSNHTRVTYWKGSSASPCVPKLFPCGVT